MRRFATLLKFRAIVGRDAVYHYEADVEALDCDGDLKAEYVFLGFKVMDVCALDTSETRFLM